MLIAYIAGKFTGRTRVEVDANILAAVAVGIEVAKLGAVPLIPHANTAHPEFEQVQPYQFWLAGTLEMLRRSDVLVCVPNWRDSSGARGEVDEMHRLGKPTFLCVADFESWFTRRALAPTYPPPRGELPTLVEGE